MRGYRDLPAWMRVHGTLAAVGVEGTGAYGAELARVLTAAGATVIDVDRPDRKIRRMRGKSDPIDAYAATTAVPAWPPVSPRAATAWWRRSACCGSRGAARSRPAPRR